MNRPLRAVAFSAALIATACSGGGHSRSASPETFPQQTTYLTVPETDLSAEQVEAAFKPLEEAYDLAVKNPQTKQLKVKVAKGVCVAISQVESGEADLLPNPDALIIERPNSSQKMIEFAGYIPGTEARQGHAIFGPALLLENPDGDDAQFDKILSDVNKRSIALRFEPGSGLRDVLANRTAADTFVDSQTGQSVMTVRAGSVLDAVLVDSFLDDPHMQSLCQEATQTKP